MWAIGKWRHYFEGRHFIVETDHSSLKHLSNQPSVNRCIWKWVGILQSYDLEIRHIPGRFNPADTLTRQTWVDDAADIARVKNVDQELMEMIRVIESMVDKDIQKKLNELYNIEDLKSNIKQAQE